MVNGKKIQICINDDLWKRYLRTLTDVTLEEDIKSFVTSALAGSICDNENIYGFDIDDSQVEIKFL